MGYIVSLGRGLVLRLKLSSLQISQRRSSLPQQQQKKQKKKKGDPVLQTDMKVWAEAAKAQMGGWNRGRDREAELKTWRLLVQASQASWAVFVNMI